MRKSVKTISLRLSKFELEELEKILQITGMSSSAFIRMAMLEKIQKINK